MNTQIVINCKDGEHRYIGNKIKSGVYRLSFQEFYKSFNGWQTLDTNLYDETYYQYLTNEVNE